MPFKHIFQPYCFHGLKQVDLLVLKAFFGEAPATGCMCKLMGAANVTCYWTDLGKVWMDGVSMC